MKVGKHKALREREGERKRALILDNQANSFNAQLAASTRPLSPSLPPESSRDKEGRGGTRLEWHRSSAFLKKHS